MACAIPQGSCTFSGFADMKKTLVAVTVECFIGLATWLLHNKIMNLPNVQFDHTKVHRVIQCLC